MTNVQKRILVWKRAKAMATRYCSPGTGVWNTDLPGYTMALNWVRHAISWAERMGEPEFANELRHWWELDNHPNDSW